MTYALPYTRRFLPVLLLVLCMLTPCSGWAAAAGTIVVGGDHNYPPYEFLDKDGHPAGFNVDLTRAIAEVMGMTVEIRLGRWEEIRKALQRGDVDIVQGMVQAEVRARDYDFSPPHSIINQSVFARRGARTVQNLGDLKGKEVFVQNGGMMHDYLLEKNVGAAIFPVDTHIDALRQLAAGKHDYALVGNLPGLYLSREFGLSNIVPVGKLFAGQPYCYAVKKGNDQILSQFSEGLAILKNTGRYQKIHDKWLGALEPPTVSWRRIVTYAAITALPLLLLLSAIGYINRRLTKEVALRTQEMQLQQQQLIQADKMASLGILVSGIAHEINNPTGLLLYNLPVLKKIFRSAEEHLEERFQKEGDFLIGGMRYSQFREDIPLLIDEMLDGATRIKRIVEDLKDFARKDTSQMDQSVLLNDVVRASLRLVENSIRKTTGNVVTELAEGLPAVRGNAQRIEQVVVNLILNACQALPDPGKGIYLTTGYDAERNEVLLLVRDEGVGISSEDLPRIADPFFTTKREAGGTGLGLSVSASIIKEHEGTMVFESQPGEGTTVRVALPALQGA
ncbi:transporter substrate-binding domain-containing protein [Geomonas sp. Red69]|uniref:transporter substrate-binding domain-containing protein n=1 Tax=Geomonas diazotrophica TaxID=2843197 RepID=UPI001C123431|nr:transporter substrate-binding domain-containing protein [Geomonas diazotrophica]MBU5636876.1 transporter substrate-binding domain-containing protein [Geomonas diazotrophica]